MKPRLIATREQLLEVVRDRRDELDLSHETLDLISGLQNGYVSKLLADPPMRGFGEMSLKAVLDALALRLAFAVIVEDDEMAKRVRGRWRPRRRAPKERQSRESAPAEVWCVVGDPQIMPNDAEQRIEDSDNGKQSNDRISGQT
jgi:hypothetical protein